MARPFLRRMLREPDETPADAGPKPNALDGTPASGQSSAQVTPPAQPVAAPEPAPSAAVAAPETGPDPELELAQKVAKRAGWVDLEEWTRLGRDPAKHVDAPKYLEDTPRALKNAQERARRAAQAAEAVIEAERAKAREDAQAKVRAAATAQDPDAAAEAARQLAANSGPSQRTQAWMAERSFLRDDPDAFQLAQGVCNRGAAAGLSEAEQLEAADMALRKRFPEHFEFERQAPQPPPPKPNGEARLSDLKPPPPAPAVQPGTRSGPATQNGSGEKGFKELPASVRADYERHFAKRFANMGLKPEDAQKRYAASYWKEQEE